MVGPYSKKTTTIDTPSNDDVLNEESALQTRAMCGLNAVPAAGNSYAVFMSTM